MEGMTQKEKTRASKTLEVSLSHQLIGHIMEVAIERTQRDGELQ